MQAIFETIFDISYLVGIFILGTIIIKNSKSKQFLLFGVMTIILVLGDSFHLVPRIIALCTDGLENHAISLGIGKLITSITMTIFYILLYYIWRLRYKIEKKRLLDILIIGLSIIRIALCLFPQNEWTSLGSPLSWGIYRNIPFLIMGLLIIILFAIEIKKNKDRLYRFIPLAIFLSFLFYALVVVFADKYPIIGMFMLPKTIAYIWIVIMGYKALKKENIEQINNKNK